VSLTDPAVLPEPACGNLVFVGLGIQKQRRRHRVTLPTKLWWVSVDDSGETIVKAGPLFAPSDQSSSDDHVYQRQPHVATRVDGKVSLLYLQRTAPCTAWELRAATFEIDPRTSLPCTVYEREPMVLAKNLRPEPLIVSAQGDTVYAVDCTGQVVAHAIPR
jgi:hypothetical protein